MGSKNPADIAIEFIEKINRRDFNGLLNIMSPKHMAVDAKGDGATGKENAMKMIRDYTIEWPDFQIYINDIYVDQDNVIIIGRTTGSCADTARAAEIKDRLIYALKVGDEFINEFRYALEDNEKNRRELNLNSAEKITK